MRRGGRLPIALEATENRKQPCEDALVRLGLPGRRCPGRPAFASRAAQVFRVTAVGRVRLGADIGGTFTDVVLDVGGAIHSTKVLTSYAQPEQANPRRARHRPRTGQRSPLAARRRRARHDLGDERAHRAARRAHGLCDDARLPRRDRNCGRKTASINTTSTCSCRRRWCRARTASPWPDASARSARSFNPLDEVGLEALAERIAAERFRRGGDRLYPFLRQFRARAPRNARSSPAG